MRMNMRTAGLLLGAVALLGLMVVAASRSGPLAPVGVTVATVESKPVTPGLFGIGVVEARHTYKIGPTIAARVKSIDVNVGDRVSAGQVLGEMDPIDLDKRIRALEAAVLRAEASLAEATARHAHARIQATRYQRSFDAKATSEELLATKTNDLRVAETAVEGARQERARAGFDREAAIAQKESLRLVAPVGGLVTQRLADPGTTIVAGQSVVELIDPTRLWVNARFDQIRAAGLASGLSARIALHSRGHEQRPGAVLRVEPLADTVTEELLAKVAFDAPPEPIPPLGELAEITILLTPAPPAPVIPNAALRREAGRVGVWKLAGGEIAFAPVRLGPSDLDGRTQALEGVAVGDVVIVHAERALGARARVHVVDHIAGVSR